MQLFIRIVLIVHVLAGAGAFVSGALAILLKKQTPRHKPVGRVYFWCMTVIFFTAIFLSVVHPNLFLFCMAVFTYYAVLIAYRALRLKQLHLGQKLRWYDWSLHALAGGCFVVLLGYGLRLYFVDHASHAVVPLVFGGLGSFGVYRNLKRLIEGPTDTLYWLKAHIGNMMGSYIGTITAFVVNQSEHIPVNPIILWLGPTAVLLPIIMIELKKVKSQPLPRQ